MEFRLLQYFPAIAREETILKAAESLNVTQPTLSRQMKEGEVLSLESVASQLNVSAMPVREAFQILARDGLIQLRKNKAAVVLGVTETYIKEHYQLRAILEGAAARLCAAPETDISELEEIYQDSCKILENKDFSRYTDINREFHNEIWTAAGNGKMKTYINKSNDEIIKKHIANMNEFCIGLSMGNMVSEEDYAKVSVKEHGEILEAIKAHDGDAAEAAMKEHIMRSRDDMLTYYN